MKQSEQRESGTTERTYGQYITFLFGARARGTRSPVEAGASSKIAYAQDFHRHARGASKKLMADISTNSTNAAPNTRVSQRFLG